MAHSEQNMEEAEKGGVFATTHWSVVRAAGGEGTAESERAIEALCAVYWPCIYAYSRRFGQSAEEARDCTQAFFQTLLEKKWTAQADRDRGRFRTFLLTRLKGFLADEWDRKQAQKRGGGRQILSLDEENAEAAYQCEDPKEIAPDRLYDRRWAFSVLSQALERLSEEFTIEGKARAFEVLKCFVGGGEALPSYAEAANQLSSTEAATKMAVSRMRRRFRELVRAEVRQTVSSERELDEEMNYLIEILSH